MDLNFSTIFLHDVALATPFASKFSANDFHPGFVLIGSAALLIVVLVAFKLISASRQRNRGKHLVDGLSTNIHSLQLRFAGAMNDFRRRGKDKDPISAPWYIMVGEPGAGKTEAIRHASLNFVRGMNDVDAGTGGTLNVDWWITDEAILLDTAGRLMFEKTADGRPSEWLEVLHLLKKARPRCPINGMILAIPCNHLFNASEKEVRKKADKIAAEFDRVQRELEVRFPVYVILTKADVLPGFRKFFANLKDPAAADQILGWSNPDNLDNNFRPELVEEHLKAVTQTLKQLRLSFIMNPKIVEPRGTRRLDQLDALYGFPETLPVLANNLSIYLNTVFTPNDWLSKPLFLRGIYFTSAMQDGSELDVDLAGKLGLASQVPERVNVWREDKTYFLKDVFLDKAFQEKGLVTSSVNITVSRRLRYFAVVGSLIAAAAAVVVWTTFGLTSMQASVGDQASFFEQGNEVGWDKLAVIDTSTEPPTYKGKDSLPNSSKTREDEQALNLTLLAKDIVVPPVFTLWAKLGNLSDSSRQRHRDMFEECVLLPYISAVDSMSSKSAMDKKQTLRVIAALKGLIEIESGQQAIGSSLPELDLQPLAAMLNSDASVEHSMLHVPTLSSDVRSRLHEANEKAVNQLFKSVGAHIQELNNFQNCLSKYVDDEQVLLKNFPASDREMGKDAFQAFQKNFDASLGTLESDKKSIEGCKYTKDLISKKDVFIYDDLAVEIIALRKLSPDFQFNQSELDQALSDLKEKLPKLEESIIGSATANASVDGWHFDQRLSNYRRLVPATVPTSAMTSEDNATLDLLIQDGEKVDKMSSSLLFAPIAAATPDDLVAEDKFNSAAKLMNDCLKSAQSENILTEEANLDIKRSLGSSDAVDEPNFPDKAFVDSNFESEFNPDSAETFFDHIAKLNSQIGQYVTNYDPQFVTVNAKDLNAKRAQYVDDYIKYWKSQRAKIRYLSRAGSWPEYCKRANFQSESDNILNLVERVDKALRKNFLGSPDDNTILRENLNHVSGDQIFIAQDEFSRESRYWKELVSTSEPLGSTRKMIADLLATEMQNRYWITPPQSDTELVHKYWSDAFKYGLRLLAADSASGFRLAEGDLITAAKKFPINLENSDAGEMSFAEYQAFCRSMTNLRPVAIDVADEKIDPNLVELRRQIISGVEPGKESAKDEEWIKSTNETIRWLDDLGKCEFALPTDADQKLAAQRLKSSPCRVISFASSFKATGSVKPQNETVSLRSQAFVIPNVGPDFVQTFNLYIAPSDRSSVEFKIDGPWPLLKLLKRNDFSVDDKHKSVIYLELLSVPDNDLVISRLIAKITLQGDCPDAVIAKLKR